jgi:hypothetical protein
MVSRVGWWGTFALLFVLGFAVWAILFVLTFVGRASGLGQLQVLAGELCLMPYVICYVACMYLGSESKQAAPPHGAPPAGSGYDPLATGRCRRRHSIRRWASMRHLASRELTSHRPLRRPLDQTSQARARLGRVPPIPSPARCLLPPVRRSSRHALPVSPIHPGCRGELGVPGEALVVGKLRQIPSQS